MDIARVEDLLDTLKEERNDEDFLIAQHKRLIGRVHTLPPEILLVIFRYCLNPNLPSDIPSHPSYTLYGRGKPIPWVLSVVCSRWRCILRGSPSMWASFNVKADTALPFLEDVLRMDPCISTFTSVTLIRAPISKPSWGMWRAGRVFTSMCY